MPRPRLAEIRNVRKLDPAPIDRDVGMGTFLGDIDSPAIE
jgi:hypothetical protein